MGSFSDVLIRNWILKLSAFGVALLLWVAVRAEEENTQEVAGVPVLVELADPGWALVGGATPASVTVRFGGPSSGLMLMAFNPPSVVIPLDEIASGDTVVLIRPAWVRTEATGVTAEDIQPSSVRLTFEPVERRTFTPVLNLTGQLPGLLALAEPPTIDPEVVWVIGPRSRLALVQSVPLLPVDLSSVSGSTSMQVAVDTERLSGLQVQPAEVRVQLEVAERIDSEVSGVPVLLHESLRANGVLQVRPSTATVMLRGARSLVERPDAFDSLALIVQMDSAEVPSAGAEGEFPLSLVGVPALLTGTARQGTAMVRNGGEPPP